MFNVPTKLILTGLLVFSLAGCKTADADGDEGDSAKSENPAQVLVEDIEKAIDDLQYVLALALIDSVKSAYADDKKYVVEAMKHFPRAMEGMILDSIPAADSRMVSIQLEMDSLNRFFVPVNVPGFESYKVDKSVYTSDFSSRTGVQPRLGNEATPWTLAVNIVGSAPQTSALRLVVGGTTVVTVNAQGASGRRSKFEDGEAISFSPEEAGQIASALMSAPNGKATLYAKGARGEVAIPLSDNMKKAIIRTYRLANLRDADREARKKRELLERKLVLARDQSANNFID